MNKIAIYIFVIFVLSIIIYSSFKGKETNLEKINNNITKKETLNLILNVISNSDSALNEEFKKCLNDTKTYFDKNKEKFSERGIDDYSTDDEIQWISMVDLLLDNNYCIELDWKSDKETFVQSINQLKNINSFDENLLDNNLDIEEWINKLNQNWNDSLIGIIDINSDSYVLFVTNIQELKELEKLSSVTNYKIFTINK